jgi:YggT family protein
LQSAEIHDIFQQTARVKALARAGCTLYFPQVSIGSSRNKLQRGCNPSFYQREDTMFVFANLLVAAAKVLSLALSIYMWIIIARAVLSWVSPDPYNPIVRFIHNLTEPVLYQVRRRLPVVFGGIDLAPVVVMLAILFLDHLVVASLFELAAGLR